MTYYGSYEDFLAESQDDREMTAEEIAEWEAEAEARAEVAAEMRAESDAFRCYC